MSASIHRAGAINRHVALATGACQAEDALEDEPQATNVIVIDTPSSNDSPRLAPHLVCRFVCSACAAAEIYRARPADVQVRGETATAAAAAASVCKLHALTDGPALTWSGTGTGELRGGPRLEERA